MAQALGLASTGAAAQEMARNRASRVHYERQLLHQEKRAVQSARTELLTRAPIGWRRAAGTHFGGRAEGKGVELFRQFPLEAAQASASARSLAEDLSNLMPWVSVCEAAAAAEEKQKVALGGNGQGGAAMAAGGSLLADQSGFRDLQGLMDGTGLGTLCPICMDPLSVYTQQPRTQPVAPTQPVSAGVESSAGGSGGGGGKQPVVTRCVHLFCRVCIDAHIRSFRVVNHNMAANAECQCPICRRPIRRHELTVLMPRDDEDEHAEKHEKSSETGKTGKTGITSGTTGATRESLEKHATGAKLPAIDGSDRATAAAMLPSPQPQLRPAATEEAFQAIPLPHGPAAPLQPDFPAIPARLLTHLAHAAGGDGGGVRPGSGPSTPLRRRSTKMEQLVSDLEAAVHGAAPAGGDGGGGVEGSGSSAESRAALQKAVVFSQHKTVIAHASIVLRSAGLRHVTIIPGDNHATLRAAVAAFNSDPTCCVFLLHAGTAAAGLTLTAARHVFLLEPFLSAAEEAQAMNRAHRIGQQHSVQVTTYYMRHSVEERLLAFRRISGEEAAATAAAASSAATATEAPGVAADDESGACDPIDVGSAAEHEAAAASGLGAGMSGGDAQGLTAAKLRALFGLFPTGNESEDESSDVELDDDDDDDDDDDN